MRTVATNSSSAAARVVDERIGSELGDRRVDLLDGLHLAHRRAAQVGDRGRRQQAHPHLPDRLRRERLDVGLELLGLRHPQPRAPRRPDRPGRVLVRADDGAALVRLPDAAVGGCERVVHDDVAREVPRAVHAEVHVQPQLVVELEPHLLADGLRLHDLVPVDLGRVGREPALRRGHRDGRAAEAAARTGERSGGRSDPRASAQSICVAGDRARGLVLGELGDAARVALLARERGRDEGVDEQHRLVERVLAGADRDDVGVVVLAGELRGRDVPDQGGATSVHLVGRDLLAVARAAEHDAERLDAGALVGDDRARGVDAEARVVVERVVARRPVVDDLVPGTASGAAGGRG